LGSHASSDWCIDDPNGVASGRLAAAHAGAFAGSLWQFEQLVASSGSSSAQCGQTFTPSIFGIERNR
jgi:hypothetical protein